MHCGRGTFTLPLALSLLSIPGEGSLSTRCFMPHAALYLYAVLSLFGTSQVPGEAMLSFDQLPAIENRDMCRATLETGRAGRFSATPHRLAARFFANAEDALLRSTPFQSQIPHRPPSLLPSRRFFVLRTARTFGPETQAAGIERFRADSCSPRRRSFSHVHDCWRGLPPTTVTESGPVLYRSEDSTGQG